MGCVLKFLRSIQRTTARASQCASPFRRPTAAHQGQVLGQGVDDVQLRTDDGRVHLLRRDGRRVREVTSDTSWPTYNGDPRREPVHDADADQQRDDRAARPGVDVHRAGRDRLQVTPVVVDGIMYVTAPNECFALDAGTGRQIWRYQQPRTQGSCGWTNRGVGVAGDRVFMLTDHAHLIALNRFTGALLWDTELDDWRKNYFATSAPLPAGIGRDLGRLRRRARRQRLRRRARSGHGQGGLAILDRAQAAARRDPKRGRARTSITAARRRGSPAATIPSSTSSTGRSATRARNTTATIGRATTSMRARSSPSTARPARSSGTTSSRRTISGTGTRRRPRC